jgi:hypothetical protein
MVIECGGGSGVDGSGSGVDGSGSGVDGSGSSDSSISVSYGGFRQVLEGNNSPIQYNTILSD